MKTTVRKRPTQADVARIAGVSQTVVSLVLNQRTSISVAPETRERVLNAIKTVGYVPDGAARSLRTGKSMIIASLIPDITNPFYPAFQRGIQDVVNTHDYDLTAYNTDGIRSNELRGIQAALRGRVDGVIATPFQAEASDFSPLLRGGAPVVIFGDFPDDPFALPVDYVFLNDQAAASELIAYLIRQDRFPLAVIGGSSDIRRREGRVHAYLQAVQTRLLPHQAIVARGEEPTEAGGYSAMQELLAHPSRPRSVFAVNDMMAMGAMVAIREAGLSVPGDIAVAGFDDIPVSRLLNPPLTTVAQFPEQLGRQAAVMLFERILGDETGKGRKIEMPYQLMIRASA